MTTIIDASEQDIDSWLHSPGFFLGPNQFTFSISTSESIWPGYANDSEPFDPDYGFADALIADAFREALDLWDSIIAPDFVEVADNASTRGEVRVAYTDTAPSLGYAYQGTPVAPGGAVGDIWMDASNRGESWAVGTHNFEGLLHEIGHVLGLKHTFEGTTIPAEYEDVRYSVMSYTHPGTYVSFSQNGNSIQGSFSSAEALTPMVLDIAVAQAIYGAETGTRTGNDTYTFTQWAPTLQTIYDAGGSDTIDVSNFTLGSEINLTPGAYSSLGQADAQAQIDYWTPQFNAGFAGFIASQINGQAELFTFTDNLGIAMGTVIENVIGSTASDTITGNDVGNVITGNGGNDVIDGGSNVDTAVFSGASAGYLINQTATGVFEVSSALGTMTTLTNVEFAQFDDETVRLLHGTGVSVNFETADPSVYQDAMNAILDFDGNSLGGNGAWLRIGSADINGDGDVDQILVNDAIGRFATVGTAEDGLVYFDDHGWAGETRVAGIYIDPLVESGAVVQGSDEDSQRRFQNDLEIENINRVLGAGDYDGDGLQEVYFALTDGTAYLHAYMHADGNIRYANYQSEQQVIDFLEANGYGAETYGGWFA